MSTYNTPVKFTKTNLYGCVPDNDADVYTVDEFIECVNMNAFDDYDGIGYPVKDKMSDNTICIKPSRLHEIPSDATHIVWFNR